MADTLEEIEAQIPTQKIEDVNILFLDVSSQCTGYCKVNINFRKKTALVVNAGALWFDPKWSHQEKYSYIFNAIMTYFEIVENIDHIVYEAYSMNIKKRQGLQVVPEMIGAIKVAAAENGIKVTSMPPQTWRSQLKIKPIMKGDKRDYKTPTIDLISGFMDVPDKSISNITNNERSTPNDLYDALGLAFGWLTKYEFKAKHYGCKFNTHIGALNQ